MKNPVLIYADFMKSDYENRLSLVCRGTFIDLAKYNIQFEAGMALVFYNQDEDEDGNSDDLVVEGIVEYDKKNVRWAAKIDWNEIKNISQLSSEEKRRFNFE